MVRSKITFFLLLAMLFAGAGLLLFRPAPPAADSLTMYCAMGIKKPVTAAAEAFAKEHGVTIELQFEGSGTLLGKVAAGAIGDLYLAADESYIETAREKGLASELLNVGYLTGVLGVASGNPKDVSSLQDLVEREDLRVGIANPEAAAVGKFSKKVLEGAGVWEAIRERVTVLKPTVEALAGDLAIGALDVAIIWDATAAIHEEIDAVHVAEFDQRKRHIAIGILTSSKEPTTALRFARYLTARDRGLTHFKEMGFQTVEGDAWAWTPKLVFFSGAMLRPAIHERLEAFAKREGVEIAPTYNGCGILVAQMKAGAKPDAYFSCDVSFMDDVAGQFGESTVVTQNDIIMLVHQSREDAIKTLPDLAKPGMRVGLAHETDSALGKLTRDLLEQTGVYQNLHGSGNVQLQSPTGDMLVNQLRAGALDAIVVYRSNALAFDETLDNAIIVDIDHPAARAAQPYAVARESLYPNLMARLYENLTDDRSRKQFEAKGFHWEGTP